MVREGEREVGREGERKKRLIEGGGGGIREGGLQMQCSVTSSSEFDMV